MAGLIKNIFRVCLIAVVAPAFAFGTQSPRTTSSKVLTRGQSTDNNVVIRRSATSVIARSTTANARRANKIVTVRPAVSRSAKSTVVRSGTRVVSNDTDISRAAVSKSGTVRSAVNKAQNVSKVNHLSRAASSRATAVFNDITKIGGGYSNCRDAYATCMDQFCANANDTYRRCFCSDRFLNFKESSENLDKALEMLADFQDNNLNAVDKTTAEVNAMYSSTAGEDAIKKDTSASQRLLDEIGEVLSGKKSTSTKNNSSSLGIINFGDLSDIGDIWGGSDSSIFGQRSAENISALEGDALYRRASQQCATITRESCSGDAMFNLASSAYSIMITQDCNIFEKNINAKKENVTQTVRKAEQLLREARLEEYRAHNSQDVNECLEKVEAAMTQPLVCGEGYMKCLDYTGKYINATTGEPIYDQLFNISSIAPTLVDSGDVLAANSNWNSLLENKRKFAATALDTCRSLAEDVWPEFKRMALIRIAQAQDDVVQNAKDNCISVIKDCYNKQTGELNDIGETSDDQYNFGAGAVATARGICYERVMGCAALYGGEQGGCQYDPTTKKISQSNDTTKKCGLQSLLTFVDTVDSAKVASECEKTLTARAHELCEPEYTYKRNRDGTYVLDEDGYRIAAKYPDGCANMSKSELRADLTGWANKFCALDMIKDDRSNPNYKPDDPDSASAFNTDIVNRIVKDIFDKLGLSFSFGCDAVGGMWYDDKVVWSWATGAITVNDLNKTFYDTYYGGTSLQSILDSVRNKSDGVGLCLNMDGKKLCEQIGGTYSGSVCDLTSNYKKQLCKWIGGTPEDTTANRCNIGTIDSPRSASSNTGPVERKTEHLADPVTEDNSNNGPAKREVPSYIWGSTFIRELP